MNNYIRIKRNILRPFISIQRDIKKLKHPIRTPDEILDMRDDVHVNLMTAERSNNKSQVIELQTKEKALNWVLKLHDTI
jgi:hypothetical protein